MSWRVFARASFLYVMLTVGVGAWGPLDRVTLQRPINPGSPYRSEATVPACVLVRGFVAGCEPYNFVGDNGCRQGSYFDVGASDIDGEYAFATTGYNGFPVFVKPVYLQFAQVVKTYVLSVVNQKDILREPSQRQGGAWAAFTPNRANFDLAFQGSDTAFAFTAGVKPPGSCGAPEDFPLCLNGQENIFWFGIAGPCNGVRLDDFCSFGTFTLNITAVECGSTSPVSTTRQPTPDPLLGVDATRTPRPTSSKPTREPSLPTTTTALDIKPATTTTTTTAAMEPATTTTSTMMEPTTSSAMSEPTTSSISTATTTLPANATAIPTTSAAVEGATTEAAETSSTTRTVIGPTTTTSTTTQAPTQTPRRLPFFGFLPFSASSSEEQEGL